MCIPLPRSPRLQNIVSYSAENDIHSLGYRGFCNAERTLRSITTLQQLYPDEMLAQTMVIADLCQFDMDELRYEYPEDLVPPHLTLVPICVSSPTMGQQTLACRYPR